jgi:hypothetical protein
MLHACMQAINAMNMTAHEKDRMLLLYEKYACNLAVLRTQRDNIFSQLSQAQQQPGNVWVELLANGQLQHKAFLAGTAATETLYGWLGKETDLFCDLFTSVVLDVCLLPAGLTVSNDWVHILRFDYPIVCEAQQTLPLL